MGRDKVVIIIFVVLTALLAILGIRKVKSLNAQIKEQKESVAKLDQRLEYVKSLEGSLELRRSSGKTLVQVPRVEDPIANKVIIKKFLVSLLSQLGHQAEVEVDNERKSNDFPSLIEVNEVPLKVGISNHISFKQMLSLFDEFRNFPFMIEVFTVGGIDVAVPGVLRLQFKYYIVPGGA